MATNTFRPYTTSTPIVQIWMDADPAEGESVWTHPTETWRVTDSRRIAVQWARETGIKPQHNWVLGDRGFSITH